MTLAACSSTNPNGGRSWTGVPARTADRQTGVAEDPADESTVETPGPDAMILRAKIYDAMAEVSTAQAAGDTERMETKLEEAMDGIRQLAKTPAVLDEAEMRELYRSVVTAYEQYYGVSDSMRTEYGAIFAFRGEMFEAMNAVKEPLLEDVMMPAVKAPSMTVPLARNRLVEQTLQYLLKAPDRHLYHWISRSATYFPMIERILKEEGVPDELKYLAMIESGLNPRARSRASAVGMWQFMSATGRAYDLKIDHWVDERRDPEKATRAAARHLRDLYAEFGNWHFVLAAYNSGAGRVRRAMKKAGVTSSRDASIWDLYKYLPRETRNYIPMYMATVMVVSDPSAFGLHSVRPGPRYAYDVVSVEGMTDLRAVARMAGTDVETVRALNPELLQWATPPAYAAYRIRLPLSSADTFTRAYAALPPAQKQGFSAHTVRRGETLGKIARRYDTSVDDLKAVNGLRSTAIRAGQQLRVPIRKENYAGVAAGEGAVRYDDSRPARTSPTPVVAAALKEPSASASKSGSSTRVHYRIRRGENLAGIARKYGVTVADIRGWNGLRGDRINAGQTLTLYPTDAPPSTPTTYRVRRGDNLSTLARRHGVSVTDLRRWNDLHSDRLRIGQRLKLYPHTSGRTSGWISYKVRRGDNLTVIARMYGTTVANVRKWNALKSENLRVGQRLALYLK